MRTSPFLLLISILLTSGFISGCSYFDSSPDKGPLPGERISILDLQQELRPSNSANSLRNIELPIAKTNQSWTQNGGNATHNMQNLTFGEADQIDQIWRTDIGKGSSDKLPLTAQPVLANGHIFTLDTRSMVRAFHDQTGRELWETSVKHEIEDEHVISGGISFADNTLYVTSGYDEVLALNAETGAILWRTKISAGSRAAPTVYNGRVFVTALNNNVMALDARNGKTLWEYEGVGETTGLLGAASPTVDENIVIAALSSGDIAALHVENGAVIWEDSLANTLRLGAMAGLSDIRGLPVLNGNTIMAISFGGKMAAFDKRNGRRLWQREISSTETPWITGNIAYVLSADYKLIAVNNTNGEILWISEIAKYKKPESRKGLITWTGPIMAGSRLILAGTDGRIAEFNPKTGENTTNWSTSGTISIPPIVANGALYLLNEDGRLLAYR